VSSIKKLKLKEQKQTQFTQHCCLCDLIASAFPDCFSILRLLKKERETIKSIQSSSSSEYMPPTFLNLGMASLSEEGACTAVVNKGRAISALKIHQGY
jgi:hypothetical protein